MDMPFRQLDLLSKKQSAQKERKRVKSNKEVDEEMKKATAQRSRLLFTLRQVEPGTPVSQVCRMLGVAEQTFYRWKSKYGGMLPNGTPAPGQFGNIMVRTIDAKANRFPGSAVPRSPP